MSSKLTIVTLAAALLAPAITYAQDNSAPQRMIAYPRPRPIPAPPGDGWVWIPPTYKTVYDRVWTEPVYQTVSENIWVGDQYGWRTVCYWEDGQYVQRQEWVLISPGHYETRTRQVLISPGGWTWGPKLEVITPGHWEWRGTTPPPPQQPWPMPRTPTVRPPELQPFSPLWDWPADSKPADGRK